MKIILLILLSLSSSAYASVDTSVRNNLKWENTKLAGHLSDYLDTALVILPITYTAINNDEKRWERTGAASGAYLLNLGLNRIVKSIVNRERPNKKNKSSFYSGHTSTAFVGAGVMCLQSSNTLCISSLALATTIGYLRIAADWHWFSDVAVGAGVGYTLGRFVPTLVVSF